MFLRHKQHNKAAQFVNYFIPPVTQSFMWRPKPYISYVRHTSHRNTKPKKRPTTQTHVKAQNIAYNGR